MHCRRNLYDDIQIGESATIVTVSNAGHWCWLDNRTEFDASIKRFCEPFFKGK